jgi:DNA-binding transcriptional LysR family regulator
MLFRQLEYLTALAREQHFARAAVACHVSQPALSAGIRKLEAELQVPIVRRGHRFEGFTPEGERVLRWAHRLLAERDALTADVGALRDGHSGELRIGVLPGAAAAVAHVTAGFAARHPRVRISVHGMSAAEIERGLGEFGLDCGVLRTGGRAGRGRRTVPLFRDRYVLLAAEDGPFAAAAEVGWADLAHVPLYRFTHAADADGKLPGAAAPAPPRAAPVETDSLPVLCTHVRAGGGCAVLPHGWLCGAPPPGLRVLPLVDPEVRVEVGLVAPARRAAAPLLADLFAYARRARLQERLDRVLPAPATAGREAPGG